MSAFTVPPRHGYKLILESRVTECRTLPELAERIADVWEQFGPAPIRVKACSSLTQDRDLDTDERVAIVVAALAAIEKRSE